MRELTRALRGLSLAVVLGCALGAGRWADPERAAELNAEGVRLFEAGEFPRALQCFEAALALHPDASEIRTNLGKSHAALGIRILEEGLPAGLDGASLRRARDSLHKALLFWPGDADTLLALGLCHLELDELGEAERVLERSTAAAPRAARGWRLLGSARERRGHTDPALHAYEQALALEPDDAELRVRLHRLRHDQLALAEAPRLVSARFRIHYPAALPRARVEALQALLDSFCADLERRWALAPVSGATVICYAPGEFTRQTGFHEHVGGAFDGRIRVAFPTDLAEGGLHLDQVVRHEAVHLLLHRLPTRPPRWLDEGLAQLLDGEDRATHRAGFLELVRRQPHMGIEERQRASAHDDVQRWAALYLHSFFFVQHLSETHGAFRLDMVVREAARGGDWEAAFRTVLGTTPAVLDQRWRATLCADPAAPQPR